MNTPIFMKSRTEVSFSPHGTTELKNDRQKCPLIDRTVFLLTEVTFSLARKQKCPFLRFQWTQVCFSLTSTYLSEASKTTPDWAQQESTGCVRMRTCVRSMYVRTYSTHASIFFWLNKFKYFFFPNPKDFSGKYVSKERKF